MDNRHQSEREYIRYHAATSGEHLVAGIHGLAHGKPPTVGCRTVALLPQSSGCLFSHLTASGKREPTAVSILAWHGGASSHPSSLVLFPLQLLPPVRALHSFSKCRAHGHSFLRSGFCSQGVTRCEQQNHFVPYGSAASRLALCVLSIPSRESEV